MNLSEVIFEKFTAFIVEYALSWEYIFSSICFSYLSCQKSRNEARRFTEWLSSGSLVGDAENREETLSRVSYFGSLASKFDDSFCEKNFVS
jgi:hypothetical protein